MHCLRRTHFKRRAGSAVPHFAFWRTPAQDVGQALGLRREAKRDGVDAVTQPARQRAVVKHVPLLRATARAYDLKRFRRVAGVADAAQVILIERRGEARPAGAALELRAGLEQGQPAEAAGEHAFTLLGEEDAAKRLFVAVMKHDAALFAAEAVDKFSELYLTGGRQIKLWRGEGVRHPGIGFSERVHRILSDLQISCSAVPG